MNFSDYLYYDETSPSCLRWKVQRGNLKQGDVAGGIHKKENKWRVCVGGTKYYAHRIVWSLHNPGQEVPKFIDHKDRNGLNNVYSNLRQATHQQNMYNRESSCSAVKFRGVFHQSENSWQQRIQVEGRKVSLGSYNNPEDQARQYDEQAKKYFGEFQVLNFPSGA